MSWQSWIPRIFFPWPWADDFKISQPPSGSTHPLRLCGFYQLTGLAPGSFSGWSQPCLQSINPHFCFALGCGLSWVINNGNWIVEVIQETLQIHKPLILQSITGCKKRGNSDVGKTQGKVQENALRRKKGIFPRKTG